MNTPTPTGDIGLPGHDIRFDVNGSCQGLDADPDSNCDADCNSNCDAKSNTEPEAAPDSVPAPNTVILWVFRRE